MSIAKLPLTCGRFGLIKDADGDNVGTVFMSGSAEHFVKAINAHDALVSALLKIGAKDDDSAHVGQSKADFAMETLITHVGINVTVTRDEEVKQ